MRIVSIADEYFEHFGKGDREFMSKRGRPCIVVVRLRFRGKRRDFAVPFRSNIAPNVPKDQYFPLPPRSTTKPRHRHGIHYIKMFPIEKRFQRRFRTEGNPYYETIQRILDANSRRIDNMFIEMPGSPGLIIHTVPKTMPFRQRGLAYRGW